MMNAPISKKFLLTSKLMKKLMQNKQYMTISAFWQRKMGNIGK